MNLSNLIDSGVDAETEAPTDTGADPKLSILQRLRGLGGGGREMWALVDQAMVSGTNFLTNIVLARFVGIETFGAFALAWMVVLSANLFQTALIVSPMTSLRPKVEEGGQANYLGALLIHEGLFATSSAAIVQVVCCIAANYFHKPEFRLLSGGLSAATFFYLVQDFLRRYLFTIRKGAAAFWIDVLSYPPQVVIIALIAKLHGLSTGGALWIVALTSACGSIVGLFHLEQARFTRSDVHRVAIRHWAMSRWLALSVILDWSSANLFFVVAPIYFGAAAAGAIRASQNLVGFSHIWFLGLENVVPAETARKLHEQGLGAAQRYLKHITLKWGSLTTLFVLAICIAPRQLLHFTYGAQYDSYGSLLRLFGLNYFLMFFGVPVRAMLQALECTAPMFWANVAMAAFSVAFASPFVRWFGLKGVVLGAIVVRLIYQGILFAALKRRIYQIKTQPAST